MRFEDHWEILKDLGEGGQGKVFLARDKRAVPIDDVRNQVIPAMQDLTGNVIFHGSVEEARARAFEKFRKAIEDLWRSTNPENLAALKVLHEPENARDPARADERMLREMSAMSCTLHRNLLRIKQADPDAQWFAAEYHPNGALSQHLDLYKGDFARALKDFRGVVAGVAELHKKEIVHRDIKPQNIFVSARGELILGDFGLVFFADDRRTRLSATLENVGSRDWMPPWAMGMRIEDVKPTFDVFCLGKVLWSMVSGSPFLRLWYYEQRNFNLEKMFPQETYITFANRLLAKCVVEHECDCLPDAIHLLAKIDKVLRIIERNGDVIGDNVERFCRVCGVGTYVLACDSEIDNSGFTRPSTGRCLKMFTCRHCGHVQLFLIHDSTRTQLPAWLDAQ